MKHKLSTYELKVLIVTSLLKDPITVIRLMKIAKLLFGKRIVLKQGNIYFEDGVSS